jgi:hypothetical protein
VERTTMEVGFPDVTAELGLTDGSIFQANANGRILIKPLAFLLTFRWDMWPRARVHPYFTFGAGGAAMGSILEKGEVSFSFDGTLNLADGTQDQFSESGCGISSRRCPLPRTRPAFCLAGMSSIPRRPHRWIPRCFRRRPRPGRENLLFLCPYFFYYDFYSLSLRAGQRSGEGLWLSGGYESGIRGMGRFHITRSFDVEEPLLVF